jgi:hypothetical protein
LTGSAFFARRGSPDPSTADSTQDLSASPTKTTKHEVFVCKSDLEGVKTYMFAHDARGSVTKATQAGYCELNVDAQGNAVGNYFCWVANTKTDTTSTDELALLFEKAVGDGVYRYAQLDLPSDLLEAKGGSGKIRTLGRAPVGSLDCTEHRVPQSGSDPRSLLWAGSTHLRYDGQVLC